MFNNEFEPTAFQLASSFHLTLTGLGGERWRESGWWERMLSDKGKRVLGDKESIKRGK